MSFDNPSRKASPWTTLKRTVKTKSLRLVRFCQSVSALQPNPSFVRSLTCDIPVLAIRRLADSRLEMQMKQMPVLASSVSATAIQATSWRPNAFTHTSTGE